MAFAIIYKVTNIINGKVYIGATEKELEQRKQEHINNINRFPNYSFYMAMNDFEIKNFKWEIIDYANNLREKYDKEIFWIAHYRSFIGYHDCNGYNMTLGGGGQFGLKGELSKNTGTKRSEHTKLILSKQKLGKNNPQFNCLNSLSPTFKDKIVGINPYTKDVIVYESTMDVERKLGVSTSGVVQCLNNKKNFMYGMFWLRYSDYRDKVEGDTFNEWIEYKRNKMVYGKPFIGFNGKDKLYFNNLSDVKKYNMQPAHVYKCLNKIPKYKIHKGYVWEYISWDEYGEYLRVIE